MAATLVSLHDEKLTEFALRLVLTGYTDVPREDDPDFLVQAGAVFAVQQPKRNAPVKKMQLVKAVEKAKAKSETPSKKNWQRNYPGADDGPHFLQETFPLLHLALYSQAITS